MIIDAHAHLREGQGRVEDFIAAMDENGIDKACVSNLVHNALQNPDDINRFILNCVQKYPDRLIGFACVLPQIADAAKLVDRYVTHPWTLSELFNYLGRDLERRSRSGNTTIDGGVQQQLGERLLTANEVAEILRVGRATVYRWAEQGWLPAIRVGNTVRFNLTDVQRALQTHPQRTGGG